MTSQISRRPNFTTQHVDQSEYNFVEFPAMGRISEKTQKFSTSCDTGRHNSAMITDRREFITK